jgi:Zn finger protein HypA/HybF involved in hydrogenase expression
MGRPRKTTEEWFEECKKRRKDKCKNLKLTENSVYLGRESLIELECTKHNIRFSYTADSILRRDTMCPECLKEYRGTDYKSWENKAREVHGDEFTYPYLKDEYKDMHSMITMLCSNGHTFKQDATSHLSGCGCRKCYEESLKKPKVSFEEYLKLEKEKFGDKFDLSKFEYKGLKEKSIYICHCKDKNGVEHGEFEQSPSAHLRSKTGCHKCCNELIAKTQTLTTEEFIEKALKVHGEDFNYKDAKYINAKENIWLTCNNCGNHFQITPDNHLRGEGCPKCNKSKLERSLGNFFESKNIEYVKDYMNSFNNLRNDFYLPKYNVIVECQGTQHFRPTYFGNYNKEKAERNLEYTISCDVRKNKIANDLGIKILYFMDKHNFKEEYLDNEVVCKSSSKP